LKEKQKEAYEEFLKKQKKKRADRAKEFKY